MKNNFVIVIILVLVLSACNNNKDTSQKFKLTGTIEGAATGRVILSKMDNPDESGNIVAPVKDGKFVLEGDFPIPTYVNLTFEGERMSTGTYFWIENTDMVFKGSIRSFYNSRVEGGKTQNDINVIEDAKQAIRDKYKMSEFATELNNPNTTDVRKKEIKKLQKQIRYETAMAEHKFLEENPTSPYAAVLIKQMSKGQSAKQIEETLKNVHPGLKNSPIIQELRRKVEQMKQTEIGIENIIKAEHVNYKVDESFKGDKLVDIQYLAAFSNDNICALNKNGSIEIFNLDGKKVNNFDRDFDGTPKVVAVDESDNIYVMVYREKKTIQKYRGKSFEKAKPDGVECVVLNVEGDEINSYKLEDFKNATGVRVKNNHLFVADYINKKIAIYNAATGKKENQITGMRSCCKILDLCVNEDNEILVANLGAFRVQSFDIEGNPLIAFGKRGREIDDFHGCCNPVSVAYLSNGAIVTVEKDPTRIKVYSKDGAKQIAGIEELVKGCRYIPMIVDSRDNVYLASVESGIIKCIPVH